MRVPVFLVIVSLALAGCGEKAPAEPDEIIITSETPTVESDPEPPSTRREGDTGHMSGFVVNDAYQPLENVVVRLPGMDLEDTTDRDGSFSFADLVKGPYLVTVNATGHYAADAIVEVKPDDMTRVKFVLTRIPPPEPWNETVEFQGFADTTGSTLFPFTLSCTCTFSLPDGAGRHSYVVEAIMDPYGGAEVPGAGNANNFYFRVTGGGVDTSGTTTNPLREVFDVSDHEGAGFSLTVRPESFPAPEFSKEFEVFVTTFYNGPPPEGFSYLE